MIRPYPPINDVTTTPDNPPKFFVPGRSRAGDQLGRAARAAHSGFYAHLRTLPLSAEPATVLAAAESLARELWHEVVIDHTGMRLQAVAITRLLRFRDDVVLELRATRAGSCEVHMRSKSRLGRGDLGANARRIEDFLDRLRRAVVV